MKKTQSSSAALHAILLAINMIAMCPISAIVVTKFDVQCVHSSAILYCTQQIAEVDMPDIVLLSAILHHISGNTLAWTI